MLSFRKGTPVAVVCTGSDEGKKIFIAPDDGAPEQSYDPEAVLDIAPSKTKIMSAAERMNIRRYLSSETPEEAAMAAHIAKLQRELASITEERKQHTYMVNKRRVQTGTKAWLQKD